MSVCRLRDQKNGNFADVPVENLDKWLSSPDLVAIQRCPGSKRGTGTGTGAPGVDMQGHVIFVSKERTIVSCGGLMASVPPAVTDATHAIVRVNVRQRSS